MTIAEELAKKQREISVAEFFEKNRHLLGFDNPKKALLTVVKEAVDNSLDACEEANILPEIIVELTDLGDNKFRVVVEDNGPGIVKSQIPKIFGKLLYGSKFYKLSQSRGQQGIGISAAVLYAQLTTGKPTKIMSSIGKEKYLFEILIDTRKNEPLVVKEEKIDWQKEHGVRIELTIEGNYSKGMQSVDEYIKQTAIVNPHATIIYLNPKAEQIILPRATEEMPKKAREIKPHPYGIEFGTLLNMLQETKARSLMAFLMNDFSKVGQETAKQICQNASLPLNLKPKELTREQAEDLIRGIRKTKIMAPSADCIVPLNADDIERGLRKEINAEFYTAIVRPPAVYRGYPFSIAVGIAYGCMEQDNARLLRFANRVPLLYQQSACAMYKAATEVNWRLYGLQHQQGSLPSEPITILISISSVWVPYTSESKEAIASYPEIIKEIKLALQEAGRQLASYLRKKRKIKEETKKRSYIEMYIPHVAESLKEILEFKEREENTIKELLKEILEKKRGKVEEIKIENPYYDEDLARIGKEEKEENENQGEV